MIRAEGLVKKFGDVTAVDNIAFDVAKGEIFAFLGPNGAGKTTTIKCSLRCSGPPAAASRWIPRFKSENIVLLKDCPALEPPLPRAFLLLGKRYFL